MSDVVRRMRPGRFTLQITTLLRPTAWLYQLTVSESNSTCYHWRKSNLLASPGADTRTINHFTSSKWNLRLLRHGLELWGVHAWQPVCVTVTSGSIRPTFHKGVSFHALDYVNLTTGFMFTGFLDVLERSGTLQFLGNTDYTNVENPTSDIY